MKVEIVSSSKREIVYLRKWKHIYIPMTKDEKKEFAPDTINACWRIEDVIP